MKTVTIFKTLTLGLLAFAGGAAVYNLYAPNKATGIKLVKIEQPGISAIEEILTQQPPAVQSSVDVQKVADEIRTEALNAFNGNKSLPLIFYTPAAGSVQSMTPEAQMRRVEQGEHILVNWKINPYYDAASLPGSYESTIKKAAQLNLPLVITLEAPESALVDDSFFTSVPDNESPIALGNGGTSSDTLSPFGPDSAWHQAGVKWAEADALKTIQQWYPNPPLVVFVSLNASKKLPWSEAANDFRYAEQYGTDLDDNALRTLIDASWYEKYRQLHTGFIDGFTQKNWQTNTRFITADQLSKTMGMHDKWMDDATLTNRNLNIWPLTTDGLSIDYSLSADKQLNSNDSPHIEANNLVYMFDEAKKDNPKLVSMLKLDDSDQISSLEKYEGFAQFALWFLRPDIVTKEDNIFSGNVFNSSSDDTFFNAIADAVEMIYDNDTLKDFWLNGKLMSSGSSPFNANVPASLQNAARWYLLDSDANPATDWQTTGEVEVWAFAIEKETPTGEANAAATRNGNTMLFIQSVSGDRSGVDVAVPGYGNVNVDATQNGTFLALTGTKIVSSSSSITSSVAPINTPNTNTDINAIGDTQTGSSESAASVSSGTVYSEPTDAVEEPVSLPVKPSSATAAISSIASSTASSSSSAETTARTIPTPVCQTGPAKLEGHVTDKNTGSGLANVDVTVGGCTTTTDSNGYYNLSNIAANDRAVVTFNAKGYYRNSAIIKVERYLEGTTTTSPNYLEFALNKYNQSVTQDSQKEIGWKVKYSFGIQIPGGAYTDKFGNIYTGNITVSRAYRKSTQKSSDILFPGEYKGKVSNGSIVPIISYGFVYFEITDVNGDPLGVTQDSIELAFPATGATESVLPLWYYDYNQGLWIEEGSAKRQTDGTYVGMVSHSGAWSLSKPVYDAPGIFKGQIVYTDGTPARDIRVYGVGSNWVTSDLSTDADGNFEIKVIPGSSFQLKAYNYKDKYEAVYGGTIPAIASGDIVETLK